MATPPSLAPGAETPPVEVRLQLGCPQAPPQLLLSAGAAQPQGLQAGKRIDLGESARMHHLPQPAAVVPWLLVGTGPCLAVQEAFCKPAWSL